MANIVLAHTAVSGQPVPSVGINANFVAIRDGFNTYAVQTDVAKTITVAHTFAADILFSDALYDIGKSGATRPRDGFFSRNLTIGGALAIPTGVSHTIGGRKFILGSATTTGMYCGTSGFVIYDSTDTYNNAVFADVGSLTLRASITATDATFAVSDSGGLQAQGVSRARIEIQAALGTGGKIWRWETAGSGYYGGSAGNLILSNVTNTVTAMTVAPSGSITFAKTSTFTEGSYSAKGVMGSIANGVATTMFTVASAGLYWVQANYGSTGYVAWAVVGHVGTANATLLRTDSGVAQLAITVSGQDVKITQTTGGALAGIAWSYIFQPYT